jgi:hypothetical protein
MIKAGTSRNVFHEGRGNVSGELAKSNSEVLSEESEVLETLAEADDQKGDKANESGAKPIYATGEAAPFHTGRGLGRGHGPETAKNA